MGARFLIVLALVSACEKKSSKYCALHPTDLAFCEPSDAAADAPMMCLSNLDCAPADPICEPSTHICVQCLANADCVGVPNAPICDPVSFGCVGCLMHADCTASNACLPDGSCADPNNVIYVDQDGSDTPTSGSCSFDSKCATITHALTK